MGFGKYTKYAKQAEQMLNMASQAYNKPAKQGGSQSHGTYPSTSQASSYPVSSVSSGYQSAAPPTGPPPTLSDLALWFDYYDEDRSGTLDREEVVNALVRTTGNYSGVQGLRDTVYGVWGAFDKDGSGGIDKREFLAQGGLGQSLQALFGAQQQNSAPYAPKAPPVQQAQPEYQLMRAQIPSGMGPGDVLQVRSPYTGQVLQVTVPDRNRWVYPQKNGPPAFDFKVPAAPAPVVATAMRN